MKMSRVMTRYVVLAAMMCVISACSKEETTNGKGDALPELIADGILSTASEEEWAFGFTPNQNTIYFQRGSYSKYTLYESHLENGTWSTPKLMQLAQENANDSDAFVSPNGDKLFFSTNRSEGGGVKSDFDIWYTSKSDSNWSEPQRLPDGINSVSNEWLPSVAANGNLYFESTRAGGAGQADLYVARFKNGSYSDSERLGESINTAAMEESPFIAPDESYIIFQRGNSTFYISYNKDGAWTSPEEIKLPSSTLKYSPYVTPDQKYLYYTSNERGTSDLYRIEVKGLNIKLPT